MNVVYYRLVSVSKKIKPNCEKKTVHKQTTTKNSMNEKKEEEKNCVQKVSKTTKISIQAPYGYIYCIWI